MKVSTRTRSAFTLGGLGVICALAAVVAGAPLLENRPLSLPIIGAKVKIWPPTPAPSRLPPRIAARVTVTSGKAKVIDQTNTLLAVVPAGFSYVLEGPYPELEAQALLAETNGSYETRGPCDFTGPDMALGAGTLTFTSTGPHPFIFYGAQGATQRLVIVGSNGGTATIKDGYDNLLATVDPGDSTFCSRDVARFQADGPANTVVTFALYEFAGPSVTYTGTATAQSAGDTDAAHLDGRARVRLKVTHTAAAGTVTVTAAGCTPANATLQPGEEREFVGFATGLSWTYSVAGCTVSFEVERLP